MNPAQVCSYRCIVSHESPRLEDFSLCILQRNNCLGNSARIPALPDPPPMAAFRGDPLTHDLAESLFIGWLGVAAPLSACFALQLMARRACAYSRGIDGTMVRVFVASWRCNGLHDAEVLDLNWSVVHARCREGGVELAGSCWSERRVRH